MIELKGERERLGRWATDRRRPPSQTQQDNPTIGLLSSKNKVVAEYALGTKSQPIGMPIQVLIPAR